MESEGEEDSKEHCGTSILDRRPLRVFGHPLTTLQQMWLGFTVPASISTVIFIASFSLDIAVSYQLFRDGHPTLAGVTIGLVYAPSVVCLVITLTRMPHLQNLSDSILWIAIQIFQCILFPVGIVHRFATRLFWSIVAITEEDPVREKALCIAAACHQVELFFFIDSFLNAAPQALLQAYILLCPQIETTNETAWTQAVSIVTSVITLSKTAALYQRFESQRAVGRKVPWEFISNEDHTKALVQLTKVDPFVLMSIKKSDERRMKQRAAEVSFVITAPPDEHQQIMEESEPKVSTVLTSAAQGSVPHINAEEDEGEEGPPSSNFQAHNTDTQDIATEQATEEKVGHVTVHIASGSYVDTTEHPNEQDDLLPVKALDFSPKTDPLASSPQYLEPITVQNIDLEDRCFWPRINTPPSTPTADPHMRPRLSISTIKNTKRPSFSTQIALPIRKPRKRGLQEDEPLGIFTAFNAWATYLLGRVLVIAAFAHFYLWPCVGLILGHYAIMVSYLCFCNPCPNFWAPFLGLIFILCPLEVEVRYQYPRIFLVMFFALALMEDLSTVILWYCGAEWEDSWYDFAFFFIIGCHGMAVLNVALYLFMFKPQVKYIDQTNKSEVPTYLSQSNEN